MQRNARMLLVLVPGWSRRSEPAMLLISTRNLEGAANKGSRRKTDAIPSERTQVRPASEIKWQDNIAAIPEPSGFEPPATSSTARNTKNAANTGARRFNTKFVTKLVRSAE